MDHDHSLSKVAIALSGGGARGDFQVGALRYLYERELGNKELGLPPRPDIIAGTSVGAINGTKLAEGFDDSLAQLENIWEGLRTNSDMYLPTLKLDELLGPLSNAARSAVMGASAFAALTGGVILSPLLIVSALAGIGVARAELLRVIESLSRTPSIYNLDPIKKIIDGHSPYWSATGPGLRGSSLAVGHDRDGRTVVVARGYDDGCYVCVRTSAADAPTPAFSPWVLLGRRIDSDPALLTDDAGFVAGVIARKPDDGRFHELRLRDDAAHRDGWDSSWIPHGFPMPEQYRGYEEGEFGVGGASVKWASAPTLGRGSNRVETFVFARGTDKLPYYRSFDRFDRRWDQFRVMRWPIPIVGGIAFGRSSDNWKFAFARRANRQIVFCPSEPGQDGWADWQAFGGEALGDITAATNGDGRLHVFVVGTDRAVWARSQGAARGNTWENWRRIGGTATSTVAAARGPNDTLTAFVRGLDYAVWHKSAESPAGGFAEGEAGWSSLGTPERTHFLTDPVAVRRPDGKLEVYAVGNDKAVYVNAQADRAGAVEFAGWHRLGGAVWTGIELRLAVVSIEAAELRHVDESGRFAEYPDERPVGVPGGVIASASIPAIFPPVKMNDKAWVDGGCRSITPIKAAIDAGARTVYAICCTSAKPKPDVSPDLLGTVEQALDNRLLQRTAPSWSEAGVIEIGVRAVTEMLTTSIQQSELTPANPWPVPVYVIQPSFDLHDPLTINPALIRIAHAYGWMRAYEATSLSRPAEAMRSSDEIIHVRRSIFEQEGSFNLLQLAATWTEYAPGFTGYPREGVDPHSEETLRNCDVAARYAISLLLDRVRVLKRELATLLDARRARRYELPPGSEGWSTRWEMPSLSAFFPHGPFARIEIRSRGGAVATAPATAP